MAKAKKSNKARTPLVPMIARLGYTSAQPHESYNPLLEEDFRVNRRFNVGMVSSILLNCVFFGGAAVVASTVAPKLPPTDLPPAEITILEQKTPPTPLPQIAKLPVSTPKPHLQKITHRPLPPKPVQVATVVPPRHLDTPVTPPTPVQHNIPQPETPTKNITVPTPSTPAAQNEASSTPHKVAAPSAADAAAPKFDASSSPSVQSPDSHPTHGPVGALANAMAPRTHSMTSLDTPSTPGASGAPSVDPARAASAPGPNSAMGARAAAVGTNGDPSQIAANTAASDSQVMDSRPSHTLSGPSVSSMSGPRLARTRALTALGPTDHSSEVYNQGGAVTANQVVGTQGATLARGVQVASAAGVVEAQFGNGDGPSVMSPSGPSGGTFHGHSLAMGGPHLSGPRGKVGSQLASLGETPGAGGSYAVNAQHGTGEGQGTGSLHGRPGNLGAPGNGAGSDLNGHSSGPGAVASNQNGTPNKGPIAQDGSGLAGPKGTHLTTNGLGTMSGPNGPSSEVAGNGTQNGPSNAGQSNGKKATVNGNGNNDGSLEGKSSDSGNSPVPGDGPGRKNSIHTDGNELKTDNPKISKSENAKPLREIQPDIPDDLRRQSFQASVVASVTVHTDGSSSVELTQGSGNAQIDQLVLAAMRKWKWQPAVTNNVKVEQTLPYRFQIEVH